MSTCQHIGGGLHIVAPVITIAPIVIGELKLLVRGIESILKTAQIIDESETSNDKVHLTSVVTIEMVGTDRQMTYKIVGSGSNETNPAQGKISDESPVGKALMDRCVGDVVEVETPGGVKAFKILEISK